MTELSNKRRRSIINRSSSLSENPAKSALYTLHTHTHTCAPFTPYNKCAPPTAHVRLYMSKTNNTTHTHTRAHLPQRFTTLLYTKYTLGSKCFPPLSNIVSLSLSHLFIIILYTLYTLLPPLLCTCVSLFVCVCVCVNRRVLEEFIRAQWSTTGYIYNTQHCVCMCMRARCKNETRIIFKPQIDRDFTICRQSDYINVYKRAFFTICKKIKKFLTLLHLFLIFF